MPAYEAERSVKLPSRTCCQDDAVGLPLVDSQRYSGWRPVQLTQAKPRPADGLRLGAPADPGAPAPPTLPAAEGYCRVRRPLDHNCQALSVTFRFERICRSTLMT
jgi:hypothetical protein